MPMALEIKRAAHDVCRMASLCSLSHGISVMSAAWLLCDVCRMASLCPLSLATNSKKKNSYSLNLCG